MKKYDEESKIKAKALRIVNYWTKKGQNLPNIFKMVQTAQENGQKVTIESFDLSKKELLQNTMMGGMEMM